VVNFGGWSGAARSRARAGGHGPGATLHDIVGEVGPDGSSHDSGQAVIGQQTAGRHVLRVEEFLPCPMESVWRVLTDPDLIARWLMPNEFRLEAGHRFAIDSDPIRRCGLGGTGHCEVLAFDEGKMLRIAWRAAHENMSGLDSTVTFTVAPEGVGTRLLIEHEGLHPCPYVITGIGCGPRGCRTSTRRIGEVPATAGAWRASIRRISEALAGDAADREG
jgi:uncharacterized protein YndB with AHSA1/START domain